MISKQIQKIQRVLLFLIAIAGLLYIAIYMKQCTEGFAITQDKINSLYLIGCFPDKTDPAQITKIFCNSSNQAVGLLNDSNYNSNIGICYTDSNDVGFSNITSGRTSYVCFNRPNNVVFDTDAGVYRDFNYYQDGDYLPDQEYQSIQTNRMTYDTGFAIANKSLNDITKLESAVYTMSISSIKYDIDRLTSTLNTSKCKYNLSNTVECGAITDGRQTLRGILNDNSVNSLSNVSTTLANSKNDIYNNVHFALEPNFYDSGVMSSEDIKKYRAGTIPPGSRIV
jgi:hypothetical protein